MSQLLRGGNNVGKSIWEMFLDNELKFYDHGTAGTAWFTPVRRVKDISKEGISTISEKDKVTSLIAFCRPSDNDDAVWFTFMIAASGTYGLADVDLPIYESVQI